MLGPALEWSRRNAYAPLKVMFLMSSLRLLIEEIEEFLQVISPWEREHLLLNV